MSTFDINIFNSCSRAVVTVKQRSMSITARVPLTGNDDTGDIGRHGAIAAQSGVVGTRVSHSRHEAIGRVEVYVDGALTGTVGNVARYSAALDQDVQLLKNFCLGDVNANRERGVDVEV